MSVRKDDYSLETYLFDTEGVARVAVTADVQLAVQVHLVAAGVEVLVDLEAEALSLGGLALDAVVARLAVPLQRLVRVAAILDQHLLLLVGQRAHVAVPHQHPQLWLCESYSKNIFSFHIFNFFNFLIFEFFFHIFNFFLI